MVESSGCLLKISIVDENYAKMHIDAKVGSYIVISVSDSGIGHYTGNIRPDISSHFSLPKKSGKGTGLGLSTVLGIVKSHGGFINVYTE